MLPVMAPRSISRPRYITSPPPIRMYSDAKGKWGVESFSSCPDFELPVLLRSGARRALDHVAFANNQAYIFELFAAVVASFTHKNQLKSRNLIASENNEAARAALTKRTVKSKATSTLVYCVCSSGASSNAPIWLAGVLARGGPADAPPRGGRLHCAAIIPGGVPRHREITSLCDFCAKTAELAYCKHRESAPKIRRNRSRSSRRE